MASIMLISENQREMQILKLAFEQKNISILTSRADYTNYVKILQYIPDIILMELPHIAHQQLHFSEMLRQHKKTKHIPLIGYGDKIDEGVKKGLLCKGVFHYVDRPLKFSFLLDMIVRILKKSKKDIGIPQQQAGDKEKDIELLFDKETLPTKKIEIMTEYVAKLMAFPFTVAKVLQLADSEKSAAGDLAKVIQADPVISAQLLKISNSVLFASLNRKIGSVKDAIIRVGFRETKRLVMSMSVMSLFGGDTKNQGFDRTSFWYHSLVCGIIAERLARQMGTVNTEEAFLAGILHDLGILLLDAFFPTVFARILEDTVSSRTQFIKAEKALLGVTHNDMVGELFSKWKLPDSVAEGVISQYRFHEFSNAVDTPGKKMALCVGLSDAVAKACGLGRECDQFVTPIENWVWAALRMPAGISRNFLADVSNQMKLYREFLKMGKQENGPNVEDKAAAEKIRVGTCNAAADVFAAPLLYMDSEGYSVEAFTLDVLKTASGKFHCIVLWADQSITADVVTQFSKIVKCTENPKGEQSPGFAPAIVFVNEAAPLFAQKDSFTGVTMLGKSCDLREMDAPILQAMH